MKSLRYIAISVAFVCLASEVFACWDPWYTPDGYYMYRVHNKRFEPTLAVKNSYPGSAINCEEWQRLTSTTIPLEDIFEVVYKMPLEDFEQICDNREVVYSNKFVEWITKRDRAIMDFILLAKTNEHIRTRRNSRWYYPSMKIGARMTIEEVAERALSVQDKRLRDRYLLQAVRALFSMAKYEECVALWDSEISLLPEDNLMRQLIQPYIAGAEFRVHNSEQAITYFAQLGDIGSMLYCAGRSGEEFSTVDALELVCEYAPNSPYIAEALQGEVRGYERICEFNWPEYVGDYTGLEFNKLYALCQKMVNNKACDNPAMWYYTMAFMSDLRGEIDEASYLLGLAEKSKSSLFIDESIKVFRIYLDAKSLPYNSAYESKLFAQLKWLDKMIVENIDDNVRTETAKRYRLHNNESYYYWNDVMRRIVLAEICPRMIKAGKTTRALQLANMADNRLFGLVDKIGIYDFVSVEGGWEFAPVELYTMKEYRYSHHYNSLDYSNSFFEMIDSLGVNSAIKYVERVNAPKSEIDRYLNARSYVNDDYLNDIVGTQYLRNMKYKEATQYLGRVSHAYSIHHNVYMEYAPFSIKKEAIKTKSDFRYDFAREMYSIEQSLNLTDNPNRKAELLLQYATGIRNSFDLCWALTQYYRGVSYRGQVCYKRNWEEEELAIAARKRAVELSQMACDMATDDEVAANINYALLNFKTVAKRYPNTTKGELVRGQCDNLVDYNAMSIRTNHTNWNIYTF